MNFLMLTQKMLIIALALIATVFSASISQANIHRLRTTPQINFTYYYLHQYPLPDAFEIVILFEQVGGNMTQTLFKLKQVDSILRAEAAKWNATVFDNSQSSLSEKIVLDFQEDTLVEAFFHVLALDQQSLTGFLDAISKHDDMIIVMVIPARSQELNFQVEDSKAKEKAIEKSKEICSKYFGMNYQRMVFFDKVIVGNESIDQTEGKAGEYFDLIEQIDQIKENNRSAQEIFFKCQIICQNYNLASGKNKFESKTSAKKIDVKQAENIAAKIKGKSSQKPLKKQKLGNPQKIFKKKPNNDL